MTLRGSDLQSESDQGSNSCDVYFFGRWNFVLKQRCPQAWLCRFVGYNFSQGLVGYNNSAKVKSKICLGQAQPWEQMCLNFQLLNTTHGTYINKFGFKAFCPEQGHYSCIRLIQYNFSCFNYYVCVCLCICVFVSVLAKIIIWNTFFHTPEPHQVLEIARC